MKGGGKSEGAARWRLALTGFGLSALILLATGLALWLLPPAPEAPVPRNLEQLDPQLRAYIAGHLDRARARPRSSQRQATLGLVYAANGLWSEAARSFSNVARLNPKEPLAPLYQAVAGEELGDLVTAGQFVRQVTNRFPHFAPGFYRLGEVALRSGDVAGAEEAFAGLISLAPEEWRGYAGLGEARLRNGQWGEAVRLLERALELNPGAASAHHLLGLAYRGQGRTNDAMLELSIGVDQVSYPMPDAWSERAHEHMRLLPDQLDKANALGTSGHAQQAVELLEEARIYHPDHWGLMNALAIAYNRAGHPDQARVILQSILNSDPNYLPALVTASYSCQAMGSNAEALAHAERVIALSPKTAQGHIAKANALLALEKDQDALAALQTASQLDSQNAEIHLEMGDICWRNLGQREEGLAQYRAATNLQPASVPAYVRLADFYLQQRDTNAVSPLLSLLRRLAPRSPELPVLEDRFRQLTNP